MSTGLVDIHEIKCSQRHLLDAIENNRLASPISQEWRKVFLTPIAKNYRFSILKMTHLWLQYLIMTILKMIVWYFDPHRTHVTQSK